MGDAFSKAAALGQLCVSVCAPQLREENDVSLRLSLLLCPIFFKERQKYLSLLDTRSGNRVSIPVSQGPGGAKQGTSPRESALIICMACTKFCPLVPEYCVRGRFFRSTVWSWGFNPPPPPRMPPAADRETNHGVMPTPPPPGARFLSAQPTSLPPNEQLMGQH